ncbi:hypothetical protein [Bosea sp. 2RAB26]|uniref:hypothetical protein n=1 Tax=Bosea sp. 2RAB26 TaxID=3237476 RepID=UPI003F903F6A
MRRAKALWQDRDPGEQCDQLRLTLGIGLGEECGQLRANGRATEVQLTGDIDRQIAVGQQKRKPRLGRSQAKHALKHEGVRSQVSVKIDQHHQTGTIVRYSVCGLVQDERRFVLVPDDDPTQWTQRRPVWRPRQQLHEGARQLIKLFARTGLAAQNQPGCGVGLDNPAAVLDNEIPTSEAVERAQGESALIIPGGGDP